MNTAGAPKEFVSAEALKRNIPIYIVKYPLNGDFSHKDIEGIASFMAWYIFAL